MGAGRPTCCPISCLRLWGQRSPHCAIFGRAGNTRLLAGVNSRAAAPPAWPLSIPRSGRWPSVFTVDVDNRYLFRDHLYHVLGPVWNTLPVTRFIPTPVQRVAAFIPSLPEESDLRNQNLSHEGTCMVPC